MRVDKTDAEKKFELGVAIDNMVNHLKAVDPNQIETFDMSFHYIDNDITKDCDRVEYHIVVKRKTNEQ